MIWKNGELIPFDHATVHILSHAANRGSEVFDVLRVVPSPEGPAVVGLRPHIARFEQSMELMGMEHRFDIATLEKAVADTVAANPGAGVVKVLAAWTEIPAAAMPESLLPSVFVAAVGEANPSVLDEPIKVMTAPMPKIPASILPPALKVAAGYTPGVRQKIMAMGSGYDDVVFRTTEGKLAEATTQSLLVVKGDRLVAPSLDTVLDGITRRLVIDAAMSADIPVEICDVDWSVVETADELFMSSTNHFVQPLCALDDRALSAPGPVAVRLGEVLDATVQGRHELAAKWLTFV